MTAQVGSANDIQTHCIGTWNVDTNCSACIALHYPSDPNNTTGAVPGGYGFIYWKVSTKYILYHINNEGSASLIREDYLHRTFDIFISNEDATSTTPSMLCYNRSSGQYCVYYINQEHNVSVANVGIWESGWTNIVPKKPAPFRWNCQQDNNSQSSNSVKNRYFCYNSENGRCAFQKLSKANDRDVVQIGIKQPSRKKDCMILPVDCGGRACCLFYRHSALEESNADSNGPRKRSSSLGSMPTNTDETTVLLQKKIRCHRQAWSVLLPLPVLPVVDAIQMRHILCYSLVTGSWWMCAVTAAAEVRATSPQRVMSPERCVISNSFSQWPGAPHSRQSRPSTAPTCKVNSGMTPRPPSGIDNDPRPTRVNWERPWTHRNWEKRAATAGSRRPSQAPEDTELSIRSILRQLGSRPFYRSTRYAEAAEIALRNGQSSGLELIRDSRPPWTSVLKDNGMTRIVPDDVVRPRQPKIGISMERLSTLSEPVDREQFKEKMFKQFDKAIPKLENKFTSQQQEASISRMYEKETTKRSRKLQELKASYAKRDDAQMAKSRSILLSDLVSSLYTGQVSSRNQSLQKSRDQYLFEPTTTKIKNLSEQNAVNQRLYGESMRRWQTRERKHQTILETPLCKTVIMTNSQWHNTINRLK